MFKNGSKMLENGSKMLKNGSKMLKNGSKIGIFSHFYTLISKISDKSMQFLQKFTIFSPIFWAFWLKIWQFWAKICSFGSFFKLFEQKKHSFLLISLINVTVFIPSPNSL